MAQTRRRRLQVDWNWVRALSGPVCGLLFFLITFYAIGTGSAFSGRIDTDPSESGRLTATVLQRNAEDLENSARFGLIGLIFFFPFLGYLYSWLRRDDGEDGWMAPTAFAAGIATAALLAVNIKLELAVSLINDYGEDFSAARALGVLAWSAHTATGTSILVLLVATALATLGSPQRSLPAPLDRLAELSDGHHRLRRRTVDEVATPDDLGADDQRRICLESIRHPDCGSGWRRVTPLDLRTSDVATH